MTVTVSRIPPLPARLKGLSALAMNLSWSWDRRARALFRRIDEPLWRQLKHNPVALLQRVDPGRLRELAEHPDFCLHYDQVINWLQRDLANRRGWFFEHYPDLEEDHPVAYFCAEFGLHSSVPIYSGGLGILAGDHCKTASDLGLPFVGVGLFYRLGYFDQQVTAEGWQEDADASFDPTSTPLVPLDGPEGREWLVMLETFGRPIHIRVWTTRVGRAPLYLLDTDLEVNHPDDRILTAKLYAGGPAMRLRQEWILGVGGVRVLRALGMTPAAWHANEGHAAFMMLERVREQVSAGRPFEDSVSEVRRSTVFTTHTPVPAGHDGFDRRDVISCAGQSFLDDFNQDSTTAIQLGIRPDREEDHFQMTILALRLAGHVNGVAQRHGAVSRQIWGDLWSPRPIDQVPIQAITNGVHLGTWLANPLTRLLDNHLGDDWPQRLDETETWDAILGLDSQKLWETHLEMKRLLFQRVREAARHRWTQVWREAAQVVAAGTLLDPNTLTIGFARRFATYKRADLLFHDRERLRALLTDPVRPVQLVIAGKAHPEDVPGKEILHSIYHFTRDPVYEGRIAFLEDYDMYLGHLLVQGVDLWLNVPRVPMEASGTSGMKAALNGVPQLSTIDGWWEEGYTGRNGWAIPRAPGDLSAEQVDQLDADQLHRILREEVAPLWYDRDQQGVPRQWVQRMKEAIRVAGRQFTSRRMLQEYVTSYYAPILRGEPFNDDPPRRT